MNRWTVFGFRNENERNPIDMDIEEADSKEDAIRRFLERKKNPEITYIQVTGPLELTDEQVETLKKTP